ncbi:hypothetical protein Purlil1_9348 [Purpureocillium lilacinum]|uniref:Secreted protein n=1 Tax=Purpureocillium lilacinum TaxID=33203 RepID=A0ABR0BQE2_PURLI|nr:hypothetical protein Purlil1_9348 [Purpureocillium lilacinum]
MRPYLIVLHFLYYSTAALASFEIIHGQCYASLEKKEGYLGRCDKEYPCCEHGAKCAWNRQADFTQCSVYIMPAGWYISNPPPPTEKK